MKKESKTYQIRYNTVSKNDTERWRLIENGNEILISDIIINGLTHTTKDWMEEINDYKWHISCVGYCEVKNNIAYITTNKEESVLTRHILKTITYRLLATLVTVSTALLLGLPLTISALFGVGELIIKPFLYFLHERIWYQKIHIKKD
jgi:uncharacterized membrane protein